jgi:hypothetical protein
MFEGAVFVYVCGRWVYANTIRETALAGMLEPHGGFGLTLCLSRKGERMLSEWMQVETLEVPRVRKQMGASGNVEETRWWTYLILSIGWTVKLKQVQKLHFH